VSGYLTTEALVSDCDLDYLGVPVSLLGEDRDGAVAFTSDWRRGAAAIHALARMEYSVPSRATAVELIWAQFAPIPEEYQDSDIGDWQMRPCQESDPGAIQVVWAKGLQMYVPGLREVHR
jgi:hypothetical protein